MQIGWIKSKNATSESVKVGILDIAQEDLKKEKEYLVNGYDAEISLCDESWKSRRSFEMYEEQLSNAE